MEIYFLLSLVAIVAMSVVAYVVGRRSGANRDSALKLDIMQQRLDEAQRIIADDEHRMEQLRDEVKRLTAERDVERTKAKSAEQRVEEQRAEQREALDKQYQTLKTSFEEQLASLREMNKRQVEAQLALIKEQMRSTSEEVLKQREQELGMRNVEQVSKIVDPLQQSLKMMRDALNDSKEKHQEALHRLDATIQANMKNSETLSESAARLTRALTGEVKVQGNFGELKLRQLLEDLGLKDGEQFSSQMHLRDKAGKRLKDDEECSFLKKHLFCLQETQCTAD